MHQICDRVFHTLVCCLRWNGIRGGGEGGRGEGESSSSSSSSFRRKRSPDFLINLFTVKNRCVLSCFQTSCTMDQNLARLQNPHRFLRENRFLEGEDPSKGFIRETKTIYVYVVIVINNQNWWVESLKRGELMVDARCLVPLEGCYSWRVIPARRPVPTSAQSPGLAIPSTSRAIPAPIGTRSVTDQGICSSPSWTHPRASPTRLS